MAEELDERSKEVLRAVVQEFITSGGPVGSGQLTRRGDFEVSPATMRNVLAELEELGYLEKPHTSAGRVPTGSGYRFFVDSLLSLKDVPTKDKELISQSLKHSVDVSERLGEASRMLHQLSQYAGVVLIPRPSSEVVSRIEFVRLRDDTVLAILVGASGQVQNKLVSVGFPVSAEELVQAQNYLNELMHLGLPIEEARGRILSELDSERSQYDALIQKALRLGAAATDVPSAERMLIEGTGSFLEQPEFSEDVRRMRALFRALDEKHKLLQLLDRVQRAREMQIFIGAESDFSAQGDVSVIASPVESAQGVVGTVGVIGPTRMDYQRVIPLVRFTAQALAALSGKE